MDINTLIIDLNGDAKKQLVDFVASFDADFSGQNGEEYLSEEAVENGYESDTEYYFDDANERYINMENVVNDVMGELDVTYYDYDAHGYSVKKIDEDKIMVVFAFYTR